MIEDGLERPVSDWEKQLVNGANPAEDTYKFGKTRIDTSYTTVCVEKVPVSSTRSIAKAANSSNSERHSCT